MTKYIFKHIRRGVISNVLFCLLLGLAGALLCISAGLWFSSYYALRDLDDSLTTIAMPDMFHIERFAEEHNIPESEIIQNIRETIYSSGLLKQDSRRIFNAIAEDIGPIPLRAAGLGLEPMMAAFTSQPIAAFIVNCEKLDYTHHYISYWDEETEEYVAYIQRVHFASFYVDDVLYLHEDYSHPRYINISFNINPDGSTPFELREKYVVMGTYNPGGGFMGGFSALTIDAFNAPAESFVVDYVNTNDEFFSMFPRWWNWVTEYLPLEVKENVYTQNIVPGNGENGFFKFTGETADDISLDQHPHMKEAIENADISSRSFQVLTTNDPLSMLRLNQRRNLFDENHTSSSRTSSRKSRMFSVRK